MDKFKIFRQLKKKRERASHNEKERKRVNVRCLFFFYKGERKK